MADGGEILAFAETLCGSGADAALLSAMCSAAAAELAGRLREGLTPEELGERFVAAAGVLALSMYCAVSDAGRLKSFKAGSLSVEYADGEASPEGLRAAADRMIADCLADRGFEFRGVPG